MPRYPTEQLNRAQILYGKGDYTSALTAFTTILEKWPDKKNLPLHVLDHRVATLIKLSRYEEALKDAKRMIKTDKTVSSGYLRAGQILRKQEQDKKALQIYELGLSSVTDPLAIKILREQSAEVKKNIVPDKAKDWLMTALPFEVLEMIMDMLEFWEMIRLLRVCRTWNTILTGMPRLWRNLDAVTPACKKIIKHKTLEVYANRSRWAFTGLNLPSQVAFGTLRMLLAKGRSLEILKLRIRMTLEERSRYVPILMDTKSLRHLDIRHSYLRFTQLFELIHALPSLVSIAVGVEGRKNDLLELSNGRIPARMRVVKFWRNPGGLAYHLGDLLADATGLENLFLTGVVEGKMDIRHLGQLRVIHLEYEAVTGLMRFPACIEKISLACGRESDYRSIPDLSENDRLWNLRDLKIGIALASNISWELLHECGDNIQDLELQNISRRTFEYVMDRISRGKFLALEKLSLCNLDVKDEELGVVALNCPQLHTCKLAFERYITGSGLRQMIERCPHLKHLSLTNNLEITFDVVDWAKSQGITVRYISSTDVALRRIKSQ
ncbi:MAG: hypothetical protein GOMPHAMPRED_006384 [Gomphillus americanus]|uniref:F-box domain-containing protein n=1 Tax=Gomphillus americanus TaxID=1940652 RepID=A0A8H3FVK7_9LECA|nr:MAG: hypothetical protein GOMPHAMPRED_006384 [Gomphillus americanus]